MRVCIYILYYELSGVSTSVFRHNPVKNLWKILTSRFGEVFLNWIWWKNFSQFKKSSYKSRRIHYLKTLHEKKGKHLNYTWIFNTHWVIIYTFSFVYNILFLFYYVKFKFFYYAYSFIMPFCNDFSKNPMSYSALSLNIYFYIYFMLCLY